jgi:hypothetical protein
LLLRLSGFIAGGVILVAGALLFVQSRTEHSTSIGDNSTTLIRIESAPASSNGDANTPPEQTTATTAAIGEAFRITTAGSKLEPGEIEIFGEIKHGRGGTGKLGSPVIDATVHIDMGVRSARQVRPDASGLFRVAVPYDDFRAIRVEAASFVGEELSRDWLFGRVSAPFTRPDKPRVIYLRPGVAVSGVVTAIDQPAVENVSVQCVNAGRNASVKLSSSALTDANGLFTVNCPLKRVKLLGIHPDYQHGVTDWIDLEEVEDPHPRIELQRGTHLFGRVLGEDGKPVSQATLGIEDLDAPPQHVHGWNESRLYLEPFPYWRLSKSDGSFDYGTLSGRLQLRATVKGGAAGSVEVNLVDQPEEYVEIRLDRGVTVSGSVTLNGEPAAHVMVAWVCDQMRLYSTQIRLTDESGKFIFKQLNEAAAGDGSTCGVVAHPLGADLLWSKKNAIGGFLPTRISARLEDDDVILKLRDEDAGRLEIKLDGAYPKYRGVFRLTPLGDLGITTPIIEKSYAYSNTEMAVFPQLRAGPYRLETELKNGLNPDAVEIEIRNGQTAELTLTIPNGMARGTTRGRVVDAETQKPLEGVRVGFDVGSHFVSDRTKADGRFESNYEATQISISLHLEGYSVFRTTIAVGEGESPELGDILLQPSEAAEPSD